MTESDISLRAATFTLFDMNVSIIVGMSKWPTKAT